jgi:hypothetical protein
MLTGHKSIYSLTYELLLFWYRSFIVYLGQEATNERSIAILAPGRFLFFYFFATLLAIEWFFSYYSFIGNGLISKETSLEFREMLD